MAATLDNAEKESEVSEAEVTIAEKKDCQELLCIDGSTYDAVERQI